MTCVTLVLHFDDESSLWRFNTKRLRSSKWTEDSPPDYILAFDDFETENEEGDFHYRGPEDPELPYKLEKMEAQSATPIRVLRKRTNILHYATPFRACGLKLFIMQWTFVL